MSIRLRLALWYGGLTGVMAVLICTVIYAVHSRAHYDDVDLLLVGSAEHVAERAAAAPTGRQLSEMLEVPVSPNVVVRAYGADGQEIAASPEATLAPEPDPRSVLSRPSGPPYDALAALAPPVVEVEAGRGAFGLAPGPGGERWRLYALPGSGQARYVVAAAPLGRIDASVARLRRLVALLAVAAAALALTTGALLAGRALRPVATLTDTAHAIARSRDFGRRVPAGGRTDELGKLADTFNGMLAALEQSYEAQRRFVADASHELRAPLTAIQGNLELLRRHPEKPPAEQREALGEADQEARRLSRLVADLLSLARADAGMSLRRRRVELDRVLLDAFAAARHLARGQSLGIGALEPALVEGDPDRLKELLLVLLDNALKYTPPEGRVTLELRRKYGAAEITVRDTGVGIPPEELERVFERFYRADPARARDPGGTGLGLPIARWIAEQHGGEISLDSEPGNGTTATVRLPLRTGDGP